MAKSDFCFTYYDGDAARDMSHMNRLERGAYTDLIISQRKFGHLTKEQIKKILGHDFESCWDAISLVLKEYNGKFFIDWLDTSEKKAKVHASLQAKKRAGKTNSKQGVTKQQPIINQTEPNNNQTEPLKDGDGYEDVIEENNKNEYDFQKPDINGDELVFPIDTAPARAVWAAWKEYRWKQHGSRYGMMGEQADLKRFSNHSYHQMEQTILTAIANNWKNLYPDGNGKRSNGNSKTANGSATSDYLAEYYRNKIKQQ